MQVNAGIDDSSVGIEGDSRRAREGNDWRERCGVHQHQSLIVGSQKIEVHL